MMRKSIAVLFLAAMTGGLMTGQNAPSYLDEYIVKVKPEKRAEFDAISKKIAALNRRNKGDTWLASENLYGEANVVTFVSLRSGFGDAQKGMDLFMGALAKPGGMAAAEKIEQESNNPLVSGRSELWRRRPDLSSNAPASPAEGSALIGKSHLLYTVTVRVRPGRTLEYEEQIKMVRDARGKAGQKQTWLVSQSMLGEQGTSFHITRPIGSLGELDGSQRLAQVLGANGYKQYQKGLAENTFSTEITIQRFLPELSNAPADIAAADPAFWNPKPPAAKKAGEATK